MQNLGNKEMASWISCIDESCFVSQGGDKGLKFNEFKGGKKMRTVAEKTEDAKKMLNVLWPLAFLEANLFLKSKQTNPSFQDIMIFGEVLCKGLAIEWGRG